MPNLSCVLDCELGFFVFTNFVLSIHTVRFSCLVAILRNILCFIGTRARPKFSHVEDVIINDDQYDGMVFYNYYNKQQLYIIIIIINNNTLVVVVVPR